MTSWPFWVPEGPGEIEFYLACAEARDRELALAERVARKQVEINPFWEEVFRIVQEQR